MTPYVHIETGGQVVDKFWAILVRIAAPPVGIIVPGKRFPYLVSVFYWEELYSLAASESACTCTNIEV